jgi:hypothetical protein
MKWQPIDTAPKDGRVILILTERGNVYSPCQWENGEISENGFWLWWQDEPAWLTEVVNPTHWMPLPDPPE